MSRIYWDSMLFIYWFEDHPQYAVRVEAIHKRIERRGDTLCTSTFGVGEILVGPHKKGASEVADKIRQFFRTSGVEVVPFREETAGHFARIRAQNKVSPPDAIHLASAAEAGIDLFLTNDRRLQGLVIPGIDFIASMDVDLF
jgi:predicted nucleic acid-binding protein